MKVHLLKTTPSANEDAAGPVAATSAPSPLASAVSSTPASSPGWIVRITNWPIAGPVILLSLAVLAWSILFRLPFTREPLSVRARSTEVVALPLKPVTENELDRLRAEVRQLSTALIQNRDQLGPLIFSLENSARELGWRVDVTLKPAVTNPGGLTNLTLHPVLFQLADEAEKPTPAYLRLLSWLRAVASIHPRAEVIAFRLRPAGAGLGKAEVELHLFSLSRHEEVAEK